MQGEGHGILGQAQLLQGKGQEFHFHCFGGSHHLSVLNLKSPPPPPCLCLTSPLPNFKIKEKKYCYYCLKII